MSYWLLKTEPETFSFDELEKKGKTNWNGVRNFAARNHLRAAKPGDLALIYHSGKNPEIVGIGKVVKGAYPDPDPERKGDWVQIDIAFDERLKAPVPLSALKSSKELAGLALLKQSRLSCMPVSPAHWKTILKLAGR